jgi:cobalt-zinc-cadmium efflux system outer membrane protein
VSREVTREIHHAYLDAVAARILGALVERQQQVAGSILPATEARYVSGSAAQADVLKTRTEAARLVQERNAATQEEREALAQLNAALDEAGNVSVAADSFPPDVSSAKPPVSLDSAEALALHSNPRLQERRASIAARTAQAGLAARAYLPDVDVSLQYGQRDRLPDMVTAIISVPVPLQRGRKQSAEARASWFDVAAAEAELRAEENTLRSEVARSYAAVERHRADVALLERAILPQARATFASASTTYQSGRGELLGVLDAMRALFATETMYVRALAEYAKALAELKALAGDEVVP